MKLINSSVVILLGISLQLKVARLIAQQKKRKNMEKVKIIKVNSLLTNQTIHFANCLEPIEKRLEEINAKHVYRRIWEKDSSLWSSDFSKQNLIKNSLGWLHSVEKMENSILEIKTFVQDIKEAGFKHIVHIGMGGSSLAALVFLRTFSSKNGLSLTVLDTTDPATIKQIEYDYPVDKILFILASKSGNTAEVIALMDYFFEKVKLAKGDKAGENFVVITDPGTDLVKTAKNLGFRKVFLNAPDIGGRYSALSYFGLIPAALLGIDVQEILDRAFQAISATNLTNGYSPALMLGAALGEMGLQNKNKVTILADKSIESLALWIEQLVAESTGKDGIGLIPIVDDPAIMFPTFKEDRLIVHLTIGGSDSDFIKANVAALRNAGYPVITLTLNDKFDLGQQFFIWEFATAVAGFILKINPFDQPNLQESKNKTDQLLLEKMNEGDQEKPKVDEGVLKFYSSMDVASAKEILNRFLELRFPGDYLALMAFLPENSQIYEGLQKIRQKISVKLGLATTVGFGPRFLHSTGQLHKGGPIKGLFIQLTADDWVDMKIPNRTYSFGNFKRAQAQGDLEVLRKHGDRVISIHLGDDIEKGLNELEELFSDVLK